MNDQSLRVRNAGQSNLCVRRVCCDAMVMNTALLM